MSARDWFAPGQVWRPQRGRHGPRVLVVSVHRADRLVEVIDASTADRIRAKRALLRFSDIRASHRLDADEPEDRAKRAKPASGEPPRRPVSAPIGQRRAPKPATQAVAVDELRLATTPGQGLRPECDTPR